MSLMTSYLIKTSNAEDFFNAIRTAKAPERFTQKFLQDLEFTSSNDRLLIGVLKGLGFLDESGVPQKRYFDYLDQSRSGRILAEAIEEAYEDLFALNKNAQKLDVDEVKGKFRSLTQGQKSENVISNMAATFKALAGIADWSKPKAGQRKESRDKGAASASNSEREVETLITNTLSRPDKLELHYNIQLILPPSRDPAVFDALFLSLRRHLL